MPTYTILDKSTKEEYDVTIGSWDEFQEILKSDNNLEQVFRMNYAYRLEKLKVSDAWRDKLKAMKKANPNSSIEIP
jgi:hypothetical protein